MSPATAASSLPALATCSGAAPLAPSEFEVVVASLESEPEPVTTVSVVSWVLVDDTAVVVVISVVAVVVSEVVVVADTEAVPSALDVSVLVVVLNRLAFKLL